MTKYICSECAKSRYKREFFTHKEYLITNDKNRCVLHCNKEDWYDIDNNGKKLWEKSNNKVLFFWHILDRYINQKDTADCNLYMVVFPVFFTDKLFTRNYIVKKDITIFGCVFLDKADFQDTIFNGKLDLFSLKSFYEGLEFTRCVFNEDITFLINKRLNSPHRKFNLIIQHSTFNKRVVLNNKDFTNCVLNFENTTFNGFVDFSHTIFEDVTFSNSNFNNKVTFRDSVFLNEVDFRDTSFNDEANFLDISSEEKENSEGQPKIVAVSNRETARILKYQFEKLGNKIEANKFHALELNERRMELEKKPSKNWQEYLVFKFHSWSSDHSTNWFVVLIWILLVGLSSSFLLTSPIWFLVGSFVLYHFATAISYNRSFLLSAFLFVFTIAMINYDAVTIGCVLDNISLLELNHTAEKTSWWDKAVILLNKISLGYLYYQFLMSVRKDTRK